MYIVPAVSDTLFTVTLPRGIRPQRVIAGYDASFDDDDPYQSFELVLDLDWSADAPHIKRARLHPLTTMPITVLSQSVRLAVGGPLSDPDVLDTDNNVLVCGVKFTPLDTLA